LAEKTPIGLVYLFNQTNVPDIRLAYRHQTLIGELEMIKAKSLTGALPDFGNAGIQAIAGLTSY